MKFKIKAYNLQELGQRANQEDSIFPVLGASTANDRLFILCDGMGGHEKGEVASSTVCQVLSQTILSQWQTNEPLKDDLLLQALNAAYDALDAKDDGAERKMGTTLTFLCLHANGATVAHIGDSRVYQLRPASKKGPAQVVFHTRDHSLVNDLVKIGEITEEEAKHHPQKNVITRAMQPCQEHRAKADIAHLTDVQSGDYFYMCSDGMLEQSTDENILYIITKPGSTDEEKLEMLRRVTEENKDNHTAHLIHIEKVEDAAPILTSAPSATSKVNGTWITPTFPKEKKRKLWPMLLCGILLTLAVAGIAAFFLMNHKNEPTQKVIKRDSMVTETIRRNLPKEHKRDSARKDTVAHSARPQLQTPSNIPSEEQSPNLKNEPTKPADNRTSHKAEDKGPARIVDRFLEKTRENSQKGESTSNKNK